MNGHFSFMLHRGLRDSRCQADEKYLIAVSSCSEAATNKLVVFTEQYVFFGSFYLFWNLFISSGLHNIVYCMNLHNRMWWTGDLSNQLNSHTLSPKLRFHKNGRTGEYLMRWYLVKKYQKVSNVLNTNVSGLWPFFSGRKTVARWICLGWDDGPWQAFCLFAFILLL